jgi:hypothetical protein
MSVKKVSSTRIAWHDSLGLGGLRFYIAVDSVRGQKYFEEKTALKMNRRGEGLWRRAHRKNPTNRPGTNLVGD